MIYPMTPAQNPCPACGAPRASAGDACLVCTPAMIPAQAHVVPPAAPLRVAGRYLVRRELGRGGFGVVLHAVDERLARPVALKLFNQALASSEEDRRRFEREALILASLDHGNVVPIYDAGVDEGRPFFAMKLVEGCTLAQRIGQGPLPEAEALAIAEQVAAALEHAHARGVLHRDIKPSNVLLDATGHAYLADFGVSMAGFLPRLTARGTVVGTLHYMPPEALAGEATERSDLYALGAVLHEAVFGRPCFDEADPRRLIQLILQERPPLLAAPPPNVSTPLVVLIARLLEKEPARRPQGAAELRAELLRILQPSGATPQAVTRPAPTGPDDPGVRLEELGRLLDDLGPQADGDRALARLGDFVSAGSGLVQELLAAWRYRPEDTTLLPIVLSLLHLSREIEARARDGRLSGAAFTGVLLRLRRSVEAPSLELLREMQRPDQRAPAGDFFTPEDAELALEPALELPVADYLLSDDELKRHEAALCLLGSGLTPFLHELRGASPDRRRELIDAVWRKADVLLLEGRGRGRSVLDAVFALADDASIRWQRLLALFQRGPQGYPRAEEVAAELAALDPAERRVVGRCLLLHPWEPLRRVALPLLPPEDFWHAIASPATPVPWLLALWRHLRPKVTNAYLKVFLVCARDTLHAPGDPERAVAAVELLKELYQVDAFHEDLFFKMLGDLDEKVRAEARRHKLLVDLDAEYLERFQAFMAHGSRRDQPIEGMNAVPLPIQRRVARRGYFLKHFVCHPVDPIALETLPHLAGLDSVAEYVAPYAINGRLIQELAKEKHLFQREDSRLALVANPKTPSHVVLSHIRFLRKDSLRKLADSRECNPVARNVAAKILGARA